MENTQSTLDNKQYKNSITLGELQKNITEYCFSHPEDKDKMIYFDCLSVIGKVVPVNCGKILELI